MSTAFSCGEGLVNNLLMKRRKKLTIALCKTLILAMLCMALPYNASARLQLNRQNTELHSRTNWLVTPSFKFDALCFLNVLTGDPFYVRYYKDEYLNFAPRLTPVARAALARLKRKLKDENKGIISAFLSLYFSATDDQTLDDMLQTLNHSARMKNTLKRTVYFNKGGWQLYESVRGDLRTIFVALKELGFADYWSQNVLPKVRQKISSVESRLVDYNVVTEVETRLGFALPSNTITVYMLYFSQPHGIRVIGARFITDISYPFTVVLQNAIHEMMHPPYDLAHDRELRAALNSLKTDSFLMDKIQNHNPSFGYNSFDSFIEEDCVRALDQVVGERLNVGREARQRWKEEDDGIHVFAVALYSTMKQENFNQSPGTFRDFLIRMIKTGKLAAGKIKPIYQAFYSSRAI
jgi:hypothetical protein